MSITDPEGFLRRFAETQLRHLAAGEATAADCASRVDAVAAAFEGTGVLEAGRAEQIAADLDLALAARSPERGTLLHAGRRAQVSALRDEPGFARIFARRARMRAGGAGENGGWDDPSGQVRVVPAGAVLRTRTESAEEDVYLLSYVGLSWPGSPSAGGRAWISVAARTSEPRTPRRHASPPSARNPRIDSANPRPSTFAGGGMTAADDAGRKYDLVYSGGGGPWYLGRLSVSPAPPHTIAWLEVYCGGESARLDLRAAPADVTVTARPRADAPGEAYLLRKAEALLKGAPGRVAGEVAGLASVVPALRAVGLLPDDSPVPGQLAALAERLGGPGRLGGTARPGELPERWAAVLEADPFPAPDAVAAAHLAAVLPETDGVSVQLAGLVTLPGEGTLIFGALRAWSENGGQCLWLRDDKGGWHRVSVQGWSASGSSYTFQAAVEPPVGPETSRVEFCVTGATTEVRADIPLTWWLA